MKVLDLFSGMGGFSLGFGRAGLETVGFCEVDPHARRVLGDHWPGVPIYGDVNTVLEEVLRDGLGPIDVVCGGFPCQPFSVAGQRRGTEDDRDLWPAMFRVIEEIRPAWVVCENVVGLDGMALDRVYVDLEGGGYEVLTFEIPACAVNAPHIRKRLWIVGALGKRDRQGERQQGKLCGQIGGRADNAGMGDSGGKGPQGGTAATPQPERPELAATGIGHWDNTATITDNQGNVRRFPESGILPLADGVPNRVAQIRLCGNAIVPQIAEQIGRAIIQAERQREERKP